MALTHTQQWKLQEFVLGVNYLGPNLFKLVLMQAGFIFSPTAHNTYATIQPSELPNGAGYSAGGQALIIAAPPIRDDANLMVWMQFNNVQWTASGGSLVTQGACMYYAADPFPQTQAVVGYIDFSGARTVLDGSPIVIGNLILRKA
jgi:hypothetical protein